MINKLVLFILGFSVWAFLHYPPDKQHLLVGAGVALIITLLCGDLFTTRPKLFLEGKRYLWFFYFAFVCLVESFKINIDMAIRLLARDIPLNPGIVKIKTNLKTDISLTYLANALTLTKGAITVDIDKQKGFIYLHWIDLKQTDKKKIEETVERLEKILAKIFE